jgi:hypothetical protein
MNEKNPNILEQPEWSLPRDGVSAHDCDLAPALQSLSWIPLPTRSARSKQGGTIQRCVRVCIRWVCDYVLLMERSGLKDSRNLTSLDPIPLKDRSVRLACVHSLAPTNLGLMLKRRLWGVYARKGTSEVEIDDGWNVHCWYVGWNGSVDLFP